MDINEDYEGGSRITNHSNEGSYNDQSEFEEDDSGLDWAASGIRKYQVRHGNASILLEGQDEIGEVYRGSVHDFRRPYSGGRLNEFLSASENETEGHVANKSSSAQLYDNSNKYGRFNHLPMLSEVLRISKILRRLMVESNRKAAVDLCNKLDAAVRNQSNATYICRSFDILFDNMVTVLRQCPPECLNHASEILGIMGYINRYEFVVYRNHLMKAYASVRTIRKYLMLALRTTISCDAVNLDLKTHSEALLSLLKEYLENAEVAENFMAISETICELSKHYQQSFQRNFTDIVDIIIGWHLESEQPGLLKRHCSKVLQQFADYFLSEIDFTLGLLGQFIEDIDGCGEELLADDMSLKAKQQTEARVGAFIGAFTSIIKAVISKGVGLNFLSGSANILKDAKLVVNKVAKRCFHAVAAVGEETIINLNEFYCIISSYDKSVENLCDLEQIMELQLSYLSMFNENQLSSFLYMILNVVRLYRTQLPLSFVSLIMKKENGALQELKARVGSKSHKLLLITYHEILIIKNVPLLQEAYRHILQDVNETITHLKKTYVFVSSVASSELMLSFYLAALSALACQTSSIIGMYALNPSILELLITNCQAANQALWSRYPTLHQALLQVIMEHSTKNHNFRQSSRILAQHQDSPSSENFSIILDFLSCLFRWYASDKLFVWIETLLQECQEYSEILTQHEAFLEVCMNVVHLSLKRPSMCVNVLPLLLKYPNLPEYIMLDVKDIALCIVQSCHDDLLDPYCKLLALLPLPICLSMRNNLQLFHKEKKTANELYHWYKTTSHYSRLRPKYFKAFVDSLDPNSVNNDLLYQALVAKSFIYLHKDHAAEYLQYIQQNRYMRQSYMQYEAARFCVAQKLRTPLGKPQDTFLAIEAVIMQYARFLSEKNVPENLRDIRMATNLQQNCHTLLGFLENLEKHIHNAAEGTAFAMLPAEKPAKTFFRVNVSTCGEWFKRIRTAANLIALNCMAPEIVIRNCEIMLQSESIFAHHDLLDRTVTSMVWALFACNESDTIHGLLSWLKSKQCKGYEWIHHVAEHAAGHYEKAAAGFLKALSTENSATLDSFTMDFVKMQLIECLYNVTIWSDPSSFVLDSSQNNVRMNVIDSIHQSSLNSHTHSEESGGIKSALLKMTEWKDFEADKRTIPQVDTFSCIDVLRTVKNISLAKAASITKGDVKFDAANNCIRQSIRLDLINRYEPGVCNYHFNDLMLLNHVALGVEQHDDIISFRSTDKEIPPRFLNDCLSWSIASRGNKQDESNSLLLSNAANARVNGNHNYCQVLLERFFRSKGIERPLSEISAKLRSNELILDFDDFEIIHGIEELTKHIQAQSTSALDAIELGSACCSQIIELHSKTLAPKMSLPSTALSLLLNLSEWLSTNRLQNANIGNGKQLQSLQNTLPEISFCVKTDRRISNILPPSEYGLGKLLNACILSDRDSGEAWFAFGNWCYRWGKKIMEASGTDQQPFERKDFKLTKSNISSIREILHGNLMEEQTDHLVDLLNSHMVKALDDESIESVNAHSQNTTQLLENELKKYSNISADQVNAILCIWRKAQKGVYGYYEEAAIAYFKYLAIQSNLPNVNKNASASVIEDCTYVTTTLRLLRLIVKHAIGLQEVLEDGLRNTPLRPWKVIVPQLFSRLNHHEPYVRHSVSDLLCRLAVNQPQLIIFPAVVGAQQEFNLFGTADSQIQLSNCFVMLLNTLSHQAPDVVLQVQLLVKELRRITLLWEEHWVQSLAQLYADYSPLYNALEAEWKKRPGVEIRKTKMEIFLRHLLHDLNKIASLTSNEPETNYERSFQERFRPHIEIVLKELEKSNCATKPADIWLKIRQLYNIFHQKPLKGNSSTLRISDISPALANMRNTNVAMPGVDTYAQSSIFIKSVDATVFILPTKTKPKKLTLIGSNGQSYTFLFKGQEDLHLDERIMQFLSISNSMMARSHGSKSNTDCFVAHHYSVIPLGSQSGLISWVENCTPLFAIYKKWQQRESALKQQQIEKQSTKSNECVLQSPATTTSTLRPSELFYNKLTPLLAERNIKVTEPRRQWPMSVLKRVLRELSAETPNNLLSKEIWCYSNNSVDWRQSVRRYTMSLAVMSVIGYVIGLGDRHLDNILIKLGTGELVHIDYNVCFEKGKSLRVPEKVPFRLSQNLKDALGLVGTEGPFRLACAHILKILRKERETLLTLLEAFVYDPLVDWTMNDDGTTVLSRGTSAHNASLMISSVDASKELQLSPKEPYESKKYDVDFSRQTLAMKVAEIKPAWLKYKNEFEVQLDSVKIHVEHLIDVRENMLRLEQERDNFTKQQALIQELEALGSARGSHALNTVTMRYHNYKSDSDSFMKTKNLVLQTVKDLDVVSTTYFNTLLRPEKIQKIVLNPTENDGTLGSESEVELLREILMQNNMSHVYTQAIFTKDEMENSFLQTHRSAAECRDLLLFYSHVMNFYPRFKIEQNPLLKYKKEYTNLIELENNNSHSVSMLEETPLYNVGQKCQKYFASLIMILLEIQNNIVQVKHYVEGRKLQEVFDSAEPIEKQLDSFLGKSSPHNRQVILLSAMRKIQRSYESFVLKPQSRHASHVYFLFDQERCYLKLLGKFIDHISRIIQGIQCPKILLLHTDSLYALGSVKAALENFCEKIVIIFINDSEARVEDVLSDKEYLKRYPEYDAALKETDMFFRQSVASLQRMQESLSYQQEFYPNAFIDSIMSCWNTNISQYMLECRSEILLKLVSHTKAVVQSYISNDFDNAYDMRKRRQFINELMLNIASKLFDGLLPYILQVITLMISDLLLSAEAVNETDLTESDGLCEHIFAILQKEIYVQVDEGVLGNHSMLMEHQRMVAIAYYWVNEQHLGGLSKDHEALGIITKQIFLSNIHNINQVMSVWKSTIVKIQSDLELHRKNIREFLETRTYSRKDYEYLLKFKEVVTAADRRYLFFIELATLLTEYTAVVLQFEVSSDDEPFRSLTKQFYQEREKLRYSEASITEVERNLVQLLDPEGKIDQCWIENVSDLLDEMIFTTQRSWSDLEKERTLTESVLREDRQKLQLVMDSPIRAEMRQILKMITKSSRQAFKAENVELFHHIRDVQQSLKTQQIKLNQLQVQMLLRDSETQTIIDIQHKVNELCSLCQKNNDRLSTLIEQFLILEFDKRPQERSESPARNENMSGKDVPILNSQVGEQKRNAYAVSVWKRIRMKLEGRDPDPNRRCSAAEQVDYIIAEATNEDNLASLYEGWTPWV